MDPSCTKSPFLIAVYGTIMSWSSGMKCDPPKMKTKRIIDWKIAYPPMCLTIFLEMIYSLLLYGGLSRSASTGSSVAKAREAKESMIILTQRSCTGFNGASFITVAAINEVIRATTLTVS